MYERTFLFNVELWGEGVPKAPQNVALPDWFHDRVYNEIIKSLARHMKVDPSYMRKSELIEQLEETDKELKIRYSEIHQKYFGRMSGDDQDGNTRAFIVKFDGENNKEGKHYHQYFHHFTIGDIDVYCNMLGWYHEMSKGSLNVMNRYLD